MAAQLAAYVEEMADLQFNGRTNQVIADLKGMVRLSNIVNNSYLNTYMLGPPALGHGILPLQPFLHQIH